MTDQIKKYFDENRFFYTAIIFALAANLLFNLFAVQKMTKKRDAQKKEYFGLRREKTRLSESLTERAEYSSKVGAIKDDIETFIKGLPAQGEMTGFIKKINRLAKRQGLVIQNAEYSRPVKIDDNLLNYAVSFPLTGSYGKIRKFIYNLENLPDLMSIDELSLTSSAGGEVSLSLKLSVYFREEAA